MYTFLLCRCILCILYVMPWQHDVIRWHGTLKHVEAQASASEILQK